LSERLRRRIEALEAVAPQEVVLTLDDGTEYRHPGPALSFFADGMDAINKGQGLLFEAICRMRSAEGCALLWQVLQAVATSPPQRRQETGKAEKSLNR
jgi:hypothetical protein